jgi:UDP-N-acetylmuramoyl-L-alanyl-D-glutamate--2,6-diaminopimelate ligase
MEPFMKICELIDSIPHLTLYGPEDTLTSGVTANSQQVQPGFLFIARKGKSHDAAQFIPKAIASGAAAVLVETYHPCYDIPQLVSHNIAELEGFLASRFHQTSTHQLFVAGITGTNGKTTTATLVKHILDHAEYPCGLIGTVEYVVGSKRYPAERTTPDVCTNHQMLAEMVQEQCKAVVMEVTSHALDQKRTAHIHFDTAVYTNLTSDHLDYHETMDRYAEAKQLLFQSAGTAVVNADCPWHQRMMSKCKAPCIITYSLHKDAALVPEQLRLTAEGSYFTLNYRNESADFFVPLAGRFNVSNALAAIGVGLSKQIPLKAMAKSLLSFKRVPGRLEPIPNSLGINIYVDFAHTHDALENTLKCVHELKCGRIISVFGCGGDRDRSKRPKMAQVSEKWADVTIVTSDNPRTEHPEDICREIASGFSPATTYIVEVDRKNAIRKAIELAEPNDIILIAGKGHETYQIFAQHTISFSDSAIAHELCTEKEAS